MSKKKNNGSDDLCGRILDLVGIPIATFMVIVSVFLLICSIFWTKDIKKYGKLPNTIDRTIDQVVHVVNVTGGWQGSGVAISEDMIMTARHVAEGGVEFEITTCDGKTYKAHTAISSKKYDLGFIKLSEPVLTPAKFGSIGECRLGQSVYVIGSPYGRLNFNSVTLGIVSGLNRNCDEFNRYDEDYGWSIAFTTDSAGHPGNSGCPVFTMDGVVRGILVGGHSPVLIYCMPVDLVLDDIAQQEAGA